MSETEVAEAAAALAAGLPGPRAVVGLPGGPSLAWVGRLRQSAECRPGSTTLPSAGASWVRDRTECRYQCAEGRHLQRIGWGIRAETNNIIGNKTKS